VLAGEVRLAIFPSKYEISPSDFGIPLSIFQILAPILIKFPLENKYLALTLIIMHKDI